MHATVVSAYEFIFFIEGVIFLSRVLASVEVCIKTYLIFSVALFLIYFVDLICVIIMVEGWFSRLEFHMVFGC